MSTGETDSKQIPGRFTLRELFVLTCLVSIAGASYSWSDTAPGEAGTLFVLASMATIAFAIRILTRWSLVGVVYGTVVVALLLLCVLLPAIQAPRDPGRKGFCGNNLHNITLALIQYETQFGVFPPAYIADANGKPMHSWRVLILPYLEQQPLYKQYRFDEPWDGPNNSKLHNVAVRYFNCPSDAQSTTNTSYVAIVGPQTIWPGQKTTKLADINDGASNTIILAELHNSGIHWMEPRDLDMTKMPLAINSQQGPGISSAHKNGAQAAFADGSVRFLTDKLSAKTLRALLTIAGSETIGDY